MLRFVSIILLCPLFLSAQWTTAVSPAGTGLFIGWCNAIDFTDTQNGFVVGDFGLFFRTSNGGATWTVTQTPVFSNLKAVDFVDSQNGF